MKYIKKIEKVIHPLRYKEGDYVVLDVEQITKNNATKGEHGQTGDIPFSETFIAKSIVIPHIEDYKMKSKSNKFNL